MMERFYLPDYSCIFGKKFANPFIYGNIDSLIWPIFNDLSRSSHLNNLLKLNNVENKPLMYHRNISTEDLRVELFCADISLGLVQGMNLGREYGIANEDVINAVKKVPDLLIGILSFDLPNKDGEVDLISEIKEAEKNIKIAGIVIYPKYLKLDLNDSKNKNLLNLLEYCQEQEYFIKIDVSNLYLPDISPEYGSVDVIERFASNHPNIIIIISGLDIQANLLQYYRLLKIYNNVWLELDPRSFGGMTPKDSFKQLFNMKGFVQNSWYRMCIGSATPTLEAPQVRRGFIEAIEDLPFSQKLTLKTWGFRNINRLNHKIFLPLFNMNENLFNKIIELNKKEINETQNEIRLIYEVKLRSYSITQLIFLTDLINDLFTKVKKEYSNIKYGSLFIRSYHTTTALIINEHEYGNYLDLHYLFAERSSKDNAEYLHTVRALENRADFNHQDHELATTFGSRQLQIPIINNKLEIGGRENFYVLVTFGPRIFKLLFEFTILK